MMNSISDMAGEAVWYKWTAVSSQPSEAEGGKQSNCLVREPTSQEHFGNFVVNAGEPATGASDQTDEPSRDERHRPSA